MYLFLYANQWYILKHEDEARSQENSIKRIKAPLFLDNVLAVILLRGER